MIFETSNKHIGNQVYFKSLSEYFDDVTNLKAIVEYLRTIDITTVNWIRDRPLTETYNALKAVCADQLLKYIKTLWEENRHKKNISIRASLLLKEFHQFLKEKIRMKDEGINFWNATVLGLRMKTICNDPKTGITKQKSRYSNEYQFDISLLKSYLENKGLLTAESYMFLD